MIYKSHLLKHHLVSDLEVLLVYPQYVAAHHRVLQQSHCHVLVHFLDAVLSLDVLGQQFPDNVFLEVGFRLQPGEIAMLQGVMLRWCHLSEGGLDVGQLDLVLLECCTGLWAYSILSLAGELLPLLDRGYLTLMSFASILLFLHQCMCEFAI